MQLVLNKCFVLNPEKNWHRSTLSFSKKCKDDARYFRKNDVIESKTRLL